MKRDDAFARFDKIAQALPLFGGRLSEQVVKHKHVGALADVVLQTVRVWINHGLDTFVVEDRIEVGVVIMTAVDDQNFYRVTALRLRFPDGVLRRCVWAERHKRYRYCQQRQCDSNSIFHIGRIKARGVASSSSYYRRRTHNFQPPLVVIEAGGVAV